jgi:hypothetical protein
MMAFIESDEILGLLQGFNPWWFERSEAVPEFRRLAYGVCRHHLLNRALKRAILLSGPRRVGKTTILLQLATDLAKRNDIDAKSVLYLSLDHPLLKLLSLPEILGVYHQSVYPEKQPAVLLLDEVQYAKDWDLQLKQLIDRHPEYRILGTGSASAVQQRGVIDSGVGRWLKVEIPTLSFYEFLKVRNDKVEVGEELRPRDLLHMGQADLIALASALKPIMPLFNRYLLVGGFPETALQTENISFCQRLLREDVVDRVLKRDMTALFGVRDVHALEKLFIYLCLQSGGLFSVQSCARDLGTTATTVSSYVEALQHANLIYRLLPFDREGKKALRVRAKVYLVDAALRNAVLLQGEEILSDDAIMGRIVETTVLRHLFAYYYRDNPEILYWRDAKHKEREVDIVVRSPSYLFPVEVKYHTRSEIERDAGLVQFCQEHMVTLGYWITKQDNAISVEQIERSDAKVLRLPAHIFCYLIGQAERLLWRDEGST